MTFLINDSSPWRSFLKLIFLRENWGPHLKTNLRNRGFKLSCVTLQSDYLLLSRDLCLLPISNSWPVEVDHVLSCVISDSDSNDSMPVEYFHAHLIDSLRRVNFRNFRFVRVFCWISCLEHWTPHTCVEDELNCAEMVIVVGLFVYNLREFDLSVARKLCNLLCLWPDFVWFIMSPSDVNGLHDDSWLKYLEESSKNVHVAQTIPSCPVWKLLEQCVDFVGIANEGEHLRACCEWFQHCERQLGFLILGQRVLFRQFSTFDCFALGLIFSKGHFGKSPFERTIRDIDYYLQFRWLFV